MPVALLLLVLLLAVMTRLSGLAEGFWIDEVISADTAAMGLGELLARSGLADVHPPGYYVGLKVWALIFGSSDLAARLFTLLISVGTVWLLMAYTSARFGRLSSLVAGLALALSPLHAHYGVEVRSYSLLAGLALAAVWCQERLLERPSCPRRQVIFVAVLSALTWVHSLGLILCGLLLVHGLLSATATAVPVLRALAISIAALFTPWLPLLLVQVFHQPEGMTAHLQGPISWGDLLAGIGPSALSSVPVLPSIVGGALWIAAAVSLARAQLAEQDQDERNDISVRPWWILSVIMGLVGPLLALTLLPLSPLTFDLIASQVPSAYGLLAISAGGIWALARVRGGSPVFKLSAPASLFLGYVIVLLAIHWARPIVNIRNLLPMVPLAMLGLGIWTRSHGRAAVGIALVWITLSASSLTALVDRADEGPIPARDDLRGAAMIVDDPGSKVVVIPRWDAPGVARYLDPDREVVGALDPAELDWSGAARISVVLTRAAAQSPQSYLEAIDGALSATHTRAERRRLRGSPAVEVVRYTTAKRDQE